MNKNIYEKSLIELDNSIFGRIKSFFRNFFKSNKIQDFIAQDIIEEQEKVYKVAENNFINNMVIPESKVNLRLQKMQKDLENGSIIEEDLCQQELQELRELYLQQIEQKKNSIEKCKNRILKIKTQLT